MPKHPQPQTSIDGAEQPDFVLVKAVQAGDVSAFGQLFKRHFTSVRSACVRRLDDVDDGEEVAQAAMVKALERIEQCQGDRMFGPWVHVMAQHMCTDSYRAGARTRSLAELLAGGGLASSMDPESKVIAAEQHRQVRRALNSLPPRQRQVVIARDVQDQRPPEIAAGMGMSTGAVDSLLMRARRRLAAAYETGADGRRRPGPLPLAGALLVGSWHDLMRRAIGASNHLRNWVGAGGTGPSTGRAAGWATKAVVSAVMGATTSVLVIPGLMSSGPTSPVGQSVRDTGSNNHLALLTGANPSASSVLGSNPGRSPGVSGAGVANAGTTGPGVAASISPIGSPENSASAAVSANPASKSLNLGGVPGNFVFPSTGLLADPAASAPTGPPGTSAGSVPSYSGPLVNALPITNAVGGVSQPIEALSRTITNLLNPKN